MLALYTRQARTWTELDLGRLGALDELLPEVAAEAPKPQAAEAPATPPRAPRPRRHRRLRSRDWAAIGQRVVGPAGLEPATYGLKVRSSTD
jgi:hypothetical protein